MISTATGELFSGFAYSQDSASFPHSYVTSVTLSATLDGYLTSFKSAFEDWLDDIWWFAFKFPRSRNPEEADFGFLTFQDWMDLFAEKAAEISPDHIEGNKITIQELRIAEPKDKMQDWLYFLFSWVSFRKNTTLVFPHIETGDDSIDIYWVPILESVFPATVAAGRVFHIGAFFDVSDMATLQRKTVNTPVDV